MKLFRFTLLFFDGTVLTGKFCVGVPLNIQSIYLVAENLSMFSISKWYFYLLPVGAHQKCLL